MLCAISQEQRIGASIDLELQLLDLRSPRSSANMAAERPRSLVFSAMGLAPVC